MFRRSLIFLLALFAGCDGLGIVTPSSPPGRLPGPPAIVPSPPQRARLTIANRHGQALNASDLADLAGRAEIELLSCSDLVITDVAVDGGHRAQQCWTIQDCQRITLTRCTATNPRTPSPNQPGHGFIIIRSQAIRLVDCRSTYTPAGEARAAYVEDHFNAFGSRAVVFERCVATGPTTDAGTAWCIDAGSDGVQILDCVGRGLGKTGITIADGGHHLVRGTTITGATDACIRTSSIESYGRKLGPVSIEGCTLQPAPGARAMYIEPGNKPFVTVTP